MRDQRMSKRPATCMHLCPQDKYLQGRTERMRALLAEAAATVAAMAASAPAPPAAGPLAAPAARAAWGFADGGTPPGLGAFVKALDEKVLGALQETVANVSSIFLQVRVVVMRGRALVGVHGV